MKIGMNGFILIVVGLFAAAIFILILHREQPNVKFDAARFKTDFFECVDHYKGNPRKWFGEKTIKEKYEYFE